MQTSSGLDTLTIDWDIPPQAAVTLYLEWGKRGVYAPSDAIKHWLRETQFQ